MVFSALGAVFGLGGIAPLSLAAAIPASVGLLVIAGRQRAGLTSFTFIFSAFFVAYSLIASISALAGLIVFFKPPYLTDIFLAHYSLACGGFVLGLSTMGHDASAACVVRNSGFNNRALIVTATLFAGLATLFELVNVGRAGGPELVMSGKAAYQSAVTSLRGTLPSEYAARIAVAVMALWVSSSGEPSRKLSNKNVIAFILLISPVLAGYIYLGRRTEILALLLIAFVAAIWDRPLRRLTLRLIITVVLVYLAFAIVLISRETIFHPQTGRITMQTFTEVGLYTVIPSRGEFGAPFAVFSEQLKRVGDAALLWGTSYIDGFALAVPSFLYPGEKPVQLDVSFYASINPDPKTRSGGIAGYGYSPILEALLNFGTLGVAIVYFVLGVCSAYFERLRTRINAFPMALFYLMVLPIGQIFHRSTFGNAVFSPLPSVMLTIMAAAMIYYLIALRPASRSGGHG